MSQEQVSNAVEAPESQDNFQINDDAGFFEALDQSVNGGILDEPTQSTSENIGDNTPSSPSEVQQDVSEDIDTLKKRYGDSSREARKLNTQLRELEPYMPILDAMREDPNLVSHVRNYFEGGGQTPQNMAEKLNLPEDFQFEPDEAFQNPNSDSAKLMGATIDGIVQRRLGTALQGQKAENSKLAKETAFRQKHNLSEDEWSDFVDYAKGKSLELDDIYYLKNRQNRDNQIADSTRKEMQDKMKEVQQQPGSLATTGGQQVETSPDDAIFNSILGSDKQLDNLFG
tara:strand:- start:852 stop:1706 length:855 start_codon:yes stop_codon:yes gene_type:complete